MRVNDATSTPGDYPYPAGVDGLAFVWDPETGRPTPPPAELRERLAALAASTPESG